MPYFYIQKTAGKLNRERGRRGREDALEKNIDH